MKTFTDLRVGKKLKIKQGSKIFNMKVEKQIGHMPCGDYFILRSDFGGKYFLKVYDGIKGFSYQMCKWKDAPYGATECKIKINYLEIIKRWFK